MGKLTQRDDQGNWCLKGVRWEQLRAGSIITKDVEQAICEAVHKLKEYELVGEVYEPMEKLVEINKEQNRLTLEAFEARRKWIPVTEQLPEPETYVLVSFSNFSLPIIGRYDENEEGGAWFAGDEDEPLVSQDMFVNAWMPLPKPYKEENYWSGGE